MDTIQTFSQVPTEIYDRPCIAKAAYKLLGFSEFFGLKFVKTCDWLAHGFKTEERKFQAQLLHPEKTKCDFRRDLEQEKRYLKQLIDAGIVKERITFKDHLTLDAKIALNTSFLAVTSPVSIPAAATAIGLRTYLQGRMHPLTALTPTSHKVWDGEPFTLLDANMAGTEFRIMDYLNGVPPTKERVKKWIRLLLQEDPDVICLQEAFDIDDIYQYIAKGLQEEGFYVVMTTKRVGVIGMTAGLLLASRYPIEDVGFVKYPHPMGDDKYAAKGVLTARIALNEDVLITVATTHMQSGYPRGTSFEEHIKWKTEQFDLAMNFIQEFNEGSENRDVILAGDFNDGRFQQKGIAEVENNYEYPAIIQGVLKKGLKDLTIPNCNDTAENYYSCETDFDPDPANVETGCARGTCFNTAAPSYRYAVDLIAMQAKKVVDLPMKTLERDIRLRLEKYPIGNQEIAQKIDTCIKEYREWMYVKTVVTDHICSPFKEGNVFDNVGYVYDVITREDLSDHRILKITLYPK